MREIPKVIHMTYKIKKLPSENMEKWKKLNPNYEFTFSDDEDCKKFIHKHFGRDYLNIFNSLVWGPNKADFWRLCKLYIEGGVYADIDLEPFASCDKIIANNTFISVIACFNPESVFQAFIAAPPRSYIINTCLKSFVKNIASMNLFRKGSTAPTDDMYKAVEICLGKKPKPYTQYLIKNKDNIVKERVYFLMELQLNPKKGLDGIYVKNHNNEIVLKSRFDGYNSWKASI